MIELYKIKSPDGSKFSSGLKKSKVSFTSKGKAWSSIGFMKAHLVMAHRLDEEAFTWYENWEVVRITPNDTRVICRVKDLECWYNPLLAKE